METSNTSPYASLSCRDSITGHIRSHRWHHRQLSSSHFGVPEPYIYDTYSIWNFIELDVGIIAASLPALKPLLSWFRDTARGLTGKHKSASAEVFQRQIRAVDNDGFALMEYGSKGEVKITSRPQDRIDD